MHGENPKLM